MFSKISRYRKVPDLVTLDAQGRMLASKDIRLLPEVVGSFRHTVTAGDRLDHLAYKYYGQPRKWWRICDANPEFLSPLALLGQEALVTVRFQLFGPGSGELPWAELFGNLRALPGVEDIRIEERVWQEARTHAEGMIWVDVYDRDVLVTYNRMNAGVEGVAAAIEEAGFRTAHPTSMSQLGQPIIIPQNVIG